MTLTALVVTTGIIALGIFDFAMVSFGRGDKLSVSRFLQPMRKYPFIIFVFGYIAGHLWGFMTPDCELHDKVLRAMRMRPEVQTESIPEYHE